MKKRQTKAQIKESEERQALQDRLFDIACGALGTLIDDDYVNAHPDDLLELWGATNTEGVGRFMTAVRDVFGLDDRIEGRDRSWMVGCHILEEWSTLPNIAAFLYRNGIRA
jgi:hypothetical protein